MKYKEFKTEDEALKEAKATLERLYGGEKREWLEASPPDSYGSKEYRVTVFALCGSPPKGTILYNHSLRIIRGFNVLLHPTFVFRWVSNPDEN
jgi:hypothetical protein